MKNKDPDREMKFGLMMTLIIVGLVFIFGCATKPAERGVSHWSSAQVGL